MCVCVCERERERESMCVVTNARVLRSCPGDFGEFLKSQSDLSELVLLPSLS